jgi:hypothetical protein
MDKVQKYNSFSTSVYYYCLFRYYRLSPETSGDTHVYFLFSSVVSSDYRGNTMKCVESSPFSQLGDL